MWVCFIPTGLLLVVCALTMILFWKYFMWEKMQNVNQIYKATNMEFMEDI